jgi:hypothetical protein
VLIERDGADGALLVATMIFGSVGILAAAEPGFALRRRDEVFRLAKPDAVSGGEVLGAIRNEHHVWAFFEDRAGGLNGIFDAAQSRDGAGAESGGIHDDGVTFDVAIKGEMGAEAGVEGRIVFEDDDGGFDGIERVATAFEDIPTGVESAETAGLAGINGIIGNVPGAAVNDERGLHREKE